MIRDDFRPMTSNAKYRGVIIDSHVHIYDCFRLSEFLSGAWRNFSAAIRSHGFEQSSIGVLMLAETSRDHWFQKIARSASENSADTLPTAGSWRFNRIPDDRCAILATGPDNESLLLIAGRQIITREDIEILGLGTDELVADGLPLRDVTNILRERDALSVVPWGVGKWLGRRGRIVRKFVETAGESSIFLGDIIGRPGFWPRSQVFRIAESRGIRVLPGTDPLPLESETTRAGECGTFVPHPINMKQPTRDLKEALRNTDIDISSYIRRERLLRFVRNQMSIRR